MASDTPTKLRLRSLKDLDKRTTAARRAAQLIADITSDLGGSEAISAARGELIRAAAIQGAMLEDLAAQWLADRRRPRDWRINSRLFDSLRPFPATSLMISMGASVPLKHRKLHSYFGLRKNAGLQSLRSRAPASDRDRLNPWRPGSDAERSVWAQALDYLSPWQAASAATDTGSHPCRSEAL